MVIIALTWFDVLIAVPIGFLIGLFAGVWLTSKYIIVRHRDRYKVMVKEKE